MVNNKSGAFNDNNLNVDTVDSKDRRVLTIFQTKNIIYTDTERRPNSLNNRDPAATNQSRTAGVINPGKKHNLSANYRFDNKIRFHTAFDI